MIGCEVGVCFSYVGKADVTPVSLTMEERKKLPLRPTGLRVGPELSLVSKVPQNSYAVSKRCLVGTEGMFTGRWHPEFRSQGSGKARRLESLGNGFWGGVCQPHSLSLPPRQHSPPSS